MDHVVCVFEDQFAARLSPLSLTRPVFDLRSGILTLREKIVHQFSSNPRVFFCRNHLEDLVQEENAGERVNVLDAECCLFINGRLLVDARFTKEVTSAQEALFFRDGILAAAVVSGANVEKLADLIQQGREVQTLSNLDRVELTHASFVNYPWDLIHANPAEIEKDFKILDQAGLVEGDVSESAVLVNKSQIRIGRRSVIKPGAVLDAEDGPIYIGDGTTVMHNAVIQGPAFVGDGSTIKIGAKIYEGTSIGEVCKVGGEVEESIIHSYSNKQHDGFLGHAYLGQWVNLGADTNNSDLKNNYGPVQVYVDGNWVDSGSQFVGLFVGDHSKSGINTMFNTGSTVGSMSNVFGAGFPPKNIPSFSWGGAGGLVEHNFDKAMATARMVMSRRKKTFGKAHEKIFKHVFKTTRDERAEFAP